MGEFVKKGERTMSMKEFYRWNDKADLANDVLCLAILCGETERMNRAANKARAIEDYISVSGKCIVAGK